MANRFKVNVKESGPGLEPIAELFTTDFIIKLGIFGRDGSKQHKESTTGETVAEVMSRHEFGIGVPERSFLRAFIDDNRAEISKDIRTAIRKAAETKITSVASRRAAVAEMERLLEVLALKWEGQIKQKISAGIAPPNAESTIKQKGSSTPLIDTGQGRASITSEVVKNRD